MDTSEQKLQDCPGLQRWAAIENELKQEIALKDEAWKSAKRSVVKLEHQLKDLSDGVF